MEKGITFVGMDAHKVAIKQAVLLPERREPVEWQLANEKAAVRRMVRKVQRLAPGEVRFCYEAGPCGYALQRWIQEAGAVCIVIAPSLIPRRPGDRIKTDRRDARKLAELYRAGLLTEVHPPTPEDEAVRDLCRARAHTNGLGATVPERDHDLSRQLRAPAQRKPKDHRRAAARLKLLEVPPHTPPVLPRTILKRLAKDRSDIIHSLALAHLRGASRGEALARQSRVRVQSHCTASRGCEYGGNYDDSISPSTSHWWVPSWFAEH